MSLSREILAYVPEGLKAQKPKIYIHSSHKKPKEKKPLMSHEPPPISEVKEEAPKHTDKKTGSAYSDGSTYGPETGDGAYKLYVREIAKTPLLTPVQEIELAHKIKNGDHEARAHMIRANLRLVVKIAQDYANYGLPLMDLISEGNIGLMKGVERFDPSNGAKLSTYAAWWIKQSIRRALANQSKTIRLPVHLIDKIRKVGRVSLALSEELGRDPTDDELSEEVGIKREKLAQMREANMRPASLDAPIGDESNTEFGEIVGDEKAISPDEAVAMKNMRNQLPKLLKILEKFPRELEIIQARFGLGDKKAQTLDEVGKRFNLTRERIRQLQNKALKRMKRVLQKKEGETQTPLHSPKTSQNNKENKGQQENTNPLNSVRPMRSSDEIRALEERLRAKGDIL